MDNLEKVPLLDESRPNGHGSPSPNDPVLPSRQPVQIPTSFTRKKK
jgi:hypothetical protein